MPENWVRPEPRKGTIRLGSGDYSTVVLEFGPTDKLWYTAGGGKKSVADHWDCRSDRHWLWCNRCETRFLPHEGIRNRRIQNVPLAPCWCCEQMDEVERH